MHVDPLFTAAQRTNQAGGRGWDFRDDHEPSKSGVTVAILAAVIVAACLIGAML